MDPVEHEVKQQDLLANSPDCWSGRQRFKAAKLKKQQRVLKV